MVELRSNPLGWLAVAGLSGTALVSARISRVVRQIRSRKALEAATKCGLTDDGKN
jgi:hypothetical protein